MTTTPINEVNSDYYGKIFYREIGEIDFLKKDNGWSDKYHPKTWFGSYAMKPKINKFLSFDEQKKLSEQEFKDYHKATYSVVLDVDNKNWYNLNKEFLQALPSDDARRIYLKHKDMPIALAEELMINWYINSKHMLSESWLKDNKEYVATLDARVQSMEQEFIEAVENQDIKGIRKATKRGINLNLNEGFALKHSVKKDNKELVVYFLNKGIQPTKEIITNSKSNEIKESLQAIFDRNQRKKAKIENKTRPRM